MQLCAGLPRMTCPSAQSPLDQHQWLLACARANSSLCWPNGLLRIGAGESQGNETLLRKGKRHCLHSDVMSHESKERRQVKIKEIVSHGQSLTRKALTYTVTNHVVCVQHMLFETALAIRTVLFIFESWWPLYYVIFGGTIICRAAAELHHSSD